MTEKKRKVSVWKRSPEYNNWKSIIQKARQFPTDDHIEEIRGLHSSRKSRFLGMGKYNAHKLIEASAQDIHMRSRAVELMTMAKKYSFAVSTANEAFKDYLLTKGHGKGSTVAERNRSVNVYVKRGVEIESSLEAFIEIMKDYIDDVDQTSWAMKRMMEGLMVASKPEYAL